MPCDLASKHRGRATKDAYIINEHALSEAHHRSKCSESCHHCTNVGRRRVAETSVPETPAGIYVLPDLLCTSVALTP